MREFFLYNFFAKIKSGSRCLDLGAGDGRLWNLPLHNKAQVVAIDREAPPHIIPAQVRWIQADLTRGLPAILEPWERFDFIMCVNVIRFLEPDFVLQKFLPSLVAFAQPNCRLAIASYIKKPRPGFQDPILPLYDFKNLVTALSDWEIENGGEFETDDERDGQTRYWHVIDLLAIRTKQTL